MGDEIPYKIQLNMLQRKLVQHAAAKLAAIRIANELLKEEQFQVFQGLNVEAKIIATWLLRIKALGQFFGAHIKPSLGTDGVSLRLMDTKDQEIGSPIECSMIADSNAFAEQIASKLCAHYQGEALQKSVAGRKQAWIVVVFQGEDELARWQYRRQHGDDLCGETDPAQAVIALARRMHIYTREVAKRHKQYAEEILNELTLVLEGGNVENGF